MRQLSHSGPTSSSVFWEFGILTTENHRDLIESSITRTRNELQNDTKTVPKSPILHSTNGNLCLKAETTDVLGLTYIEQAL